MNLRVLDRIDSLDIEAELARGAASAREGSKRSSDMPESSFSSHDHLLHSNFSPSRRRLALRARREGNSRESASNSSIPSPPTSPHVAIRGYRNSPREGRQHRRNDDWGSPSRIPRRPARGRSVPIKSTSTSGSILPCPTSARSSPSVSDRTVLKTNSSDGVMFGVMALPLPPVCPSHAHQ
jgi:hypothetical protein